MWPTTKFIVRFDDIAPGMAWSRFLPLKARLERLNVKSVLGVVPDCRDDNLTVENPRSDFFDLIRQFKRYGDTIAQHGTFHVYETSDAGLLQLTARSEYAGLPYAIQLSKLRHGKDVLMREHVWEPYFMAPSHSLDQATLKALKETGFLAITDGFGFRPYSVDGLTFVPQLAETPVNLGFGVQTLCLHVNSMAPSKLEQVVRFVERNHQSFRDFRTVASSPSSPSAFNALSRWATQGGLSLLRSIKGRH